MRHLRTDSPQSVSAASDSFDPYAGCEVLRTVVEQAIAPFRWLPDDELEDLRDFLIVHVTTHPAMAPLYDRIRRREPGERSGVQGAADDERSLRDLTVASARAAGGGKP